VWYGGAVVRFWLTAGLLIGVVLTDLAALSADSPRSATPGHHAQQGFRNLNPEYTYSMAGRAARLLQRGFTRLPTRGTLLTVLANDGDALRANGHDPTATWIGHATFLVQMEGVNVLTDPHWGERASPVSFAGPRRLIPPGMRFEDLPPIHAVVISHDHYDHLDTGTIQRLARDHRPTFFAPLGLKAWLADFGIRDVVELDWWQSQAFRGLEFTCTPAQHSSGRGLNDQNLRLWSSWVITSPNRRFFFAGDTGYDPTLQEIGRRLGPFDLAAIPIGGYSSQTRRHPNHVNPEEAVALFRDVRGRVMVPMHWGTFDMNVEPFKEPPERMMSEALRRGLETRMAPLSPGQTLDF
jgi:N-acyl-phosphatidylethanolamine-hydrolysing phospholipase D